jgi:hypothetical protein
MAEARCFKVDNFHEEDLLRNLRYFYNTYKYEKAKSKKMGVGWGEFTKVGTLYFLS